MRILTVFFDRTGAYTRLLTVFYKSLKKHMPGASLAVLRVPAPENSNTFLDTFYGFIPAIEEAMKTKELICVADADLMVTGDFSEIENESFDLAVTVRNGQFRYNTGVWFYRPSEKGRRFLELWKENTIKVFNNFSMAVIMEYGGIDQQSLYETIEQYKKIDSSFKIKFLPCREWNCEQTEWKNRDEKTKIIHIKSGLRPVCLGQKELQEKHRYLKDIVKEWQDYDNS